MRTSAIITILAMFGLAGCMLDAGPDVETQEQAVTTPARVLTLGDSFASGTGIHVYDSEYDERYGGYESGYKLTKRSDNECWREDDLTPGPRRANAMGAQSVFMACKGAEVSHVKNQLTVAGIRHPDSKAAGWANTEILVTIGGNDLRTEDGMDWPELLEHCIKEMYIGGCQKKDYNQIDNWSTISSRLRSLYFTLAQTAPNARVGIMGYPYLMKPYHNWLGWHCSDVTWLNGNEAVWIDDQVDELNSRIEDAISYVKAYYPNFDIRFIPVTSYLPSGACDGQGSSAYINDKVCNGWFGSDSDGWEPSDSSFHPGLNGYKAFYNAITAKWGAPTPAVTAPTGGY